MTHGTRGVESEAGALPTYRPLVDQPINIRLVLQVGEALSRTHLLAPLGREGDVLTVATADPANVQAMAKLRQRMACEVNPLLSSATEIGLLLDRVFRPEEPPDVWPAVRRVLLETGFLTPHELASLEPQQKPVRTAGAGAQPARGMLIEEDFVEALSLALYLPRLRLDRYRISPAFARIVPQHFAEENQVVAVLPIDGEMVVASPGPILGSVLDDLRNLTGFEPRPALCTPSEWRRAMERAYGEPPDEQHPAPGLLWQQLVASRAVDRDQLAEAQAVAKQTGEPVEQILLRLGEISEFQLLEGKARLHGTRLVRLAKIQIERSVARMVPERLARRYRCLGLRKVQRSVLAAMADAIDADTKKMLEVIYGQPVEVVLCTTRELDEALEVVYTLTPERPSRPERLPLRDYLLRAGWLIASDLADGLQHQRQTGQDLGKCLLDLGLLDETGLAEITGLQRRVPWVDILQYGIRAETLQLVPEDTARLHNVVPLYQEGLLLTIATAHPEDEAALQAISEHTGLVPRVVVAGEKAIEAAIERLYGVDLSKVAKELRDFGEVLVKSGRLKREQLLHVWHRHLEAEVPFDLAISSLGFLSEQQLADAIADYLRLPQVDLRYRRVPVTIIDGLGVEREVFWSTEPIDTEVARLLPENIARLCTAIPVKRDGGTIAIAFANPLEEATWRMVQEQLDQPISLLVAPRSHVEEAMRRVYDRRVLGDLLLDADLINRRQLEEGLELHRRTGVRLGKALLSLGYITQDQLVASLSKQQNLPYYNLTGVEIPEDIARCIPENLSRKRGLLPLAKQEGVITLAMVDPLDREAILEVEQITGCQVIPVVTTEEDLENALERIYRRDYLWQSANDLVFRFPEESAIRVLTTRQEAMALVCLGIAVLLLVIDPVTFMTAIAVVSTAFYVGFSAYKFYLIYKALSHTLEVETTTEEIADLADHDLPVYTVLVPLYREVEVLPTLIRAIDDLDYPKTKLDVKLLLEEDDEATIAAVRRQPLPAHFKVVVVPDSLPKGKPKACNYGLIHAEGEYVVIYDAEDIPDRDQLKKVLVAFRKAGDEVQCIQAKLNYYNRDQNLLTRWFTTEYSMWFDLFIPGLDASNSPIPLGGTSNHFRTARLRELGAWDPYNVTEDADLGVRLFKAGWKTAVVDSTTYEEANSELYNWIRQRSRWVKGYIQTYLVHMRHPVKLIREIGWYQFFSFNMVVGGTFFGFLVNPIYWLLTAGWFLFHWEFIQQLFPGPVFYLGALGLYFGNFAFMYANVAGCMRRQYYDMVKYALLSPLYWALMSVGAWKGCLQLFYRPSYWEKTKHGLFKGTVNTTEAVASSEAG